ncbi:MAG: hypothetical protein LIO95_01960 [Clostridiales bacterium]|nr:hypothetical protein [Clostridiales bacterium]
MELAAATPGHPSPILSKFPQNNQSKMDLICLPERGMNALFLSLTFSPHAAEDGTADMLCLPGRGFPVSALL